MTRRKNLPRFEAALRDFYWRFVVHITDAITDTRAQKPVCPSAERITKLVFPHDKQWEEQNTYIITTTLSSFTRAQKLFCHTAAHCIIGVCAWPTLRGAKHFPITSYFFCAWFEKKHFLTFLCLVCIHCALIFYYTEAILMKRTPKQCTNKNCS